ncbi:L-threonylcarbamoyladenylate synthase [Asticcacaulis sp. EMRT-3]|uniref:L-threonylcarbamoyladenylate synthase n=1 Tax=Asticcacaulis sp. EMRT-3 TaxID=3040349 RepID=UPI0024AEF567|nr:L-threonylcarbamoyladenylate synthase [Asticcacaulis sp. EMRT-3]MDI7774625.1 L-threonylcarbamoyladenylate synthase [Asticcacaulis sp. EMRT-3]
MSEVEAAASALREGRLIHLPTETVYGLAARADDPEAVIRVFEAKGRPRFNPLIVHIGDIELARRIGRFDARAEKLAAVFWPGPLTLVVPVRDASAACDLARAGLDSVALRMPDHAVALDILRAVPFGVVAPSANRSGRPSPSTQGHAFEETGAYVAESPDGGPCRVGVESTVISLIGEARYLRAGAVSRAEITGLIGPLALDETEGHRSPGRLSLHYAPDAPVRINIDAPTPGAAYLSFGSSDYQGPLFPLSGKGDLHEAAANLFRCLREADRLRPAAIEIAPIPEHGIGEAINDRIRRAAGFIG